MAHILVVEDDDLMCKMLVDILSDEGHEVHWVGSGEDAVRWSRLGHRLDLVLTDVRMPGLGGLVAFEELRRQRPGLRGIIMTGYASNEAPGQAVRSGAWDYLYKPFGADELNRAVQRVLEADQLEAQTQSRLASLWEGARRWLKRPTPGGGESMRSRAFRAFHAGIRSRLLGCHEALVAWDALERVERIFQERGESVPVDAEFRKVVLLIEGLKREGAILYWETERQPEQVPLPIFLDFFERIGSGDIPAHTLSTAVSLRNLRPEQLVGNPSLRAMVQEVWGQAAAV